MAVRIKQRRGTTTEWESAASVVLENGEVGVEYNPSNPNEQKFKIGDGVSKWSELQYYENTSTILDGSGLTNLSGLSSKLLPTGGTTSQVLSKNGPSDYDVEWISPSELPIALDNLSDVNTSGVQNTNTLIYNSSTQSWTVGKPIGRTIFVQATEPTGGVDGDLWFW